MFKGGSSAAGLGNVKGGGFVVQALPSPVELSA